MTRSETSAKGNTMTQAEKIRQYSQRLRRNMTKEERHLWYDFLRSYPVRFSRQKVLGKYIADFYSAEAKLVIELPNDENDWVSHRIIKFLSSFKVFIIPCSFSD